jgi:hypothetical protein
VIGLLTAVLLSLGATSVSRAQEGEPDANGGSEDGVIEVAEARKIVIAGEGQMP